MTRVGAREYFRRGLTLVLLTSGLAGIPYWDGLIIGILMGAALLFYLLFPRSSPPPKALTYERIPAVYGPDFIGFFMTSVFLALPFWARAGNDGYLYEGFLLVHPAAVLTWPLALLSIFILVIAANYASYWIVIEAKGLTIFSAKEEKFLPFEQMEEVIPHRKGLPKWIRFLTPLMVLTGKYTAAGAVLLARDTTGMSIKLKNGTAINIPSDAFEKPFKKILKALRAHNIPVNSDLQT